MAPVLYWFPVSPFARAIRYFLLASNIEHETKIVDLMKGEQKTEEYKAINPHQKVPALVDGDLKLFESGAIIRYLALQYKSDLLPYHKGAAEAAVVDRELDWINGSIARAINTLNFEKKFKALLGKGETNKDAVAQNEQDLAGHLARANELYFSESPEHVIGTTTTAADVLLGLYLAQASISQIDLAPYPKLVTFYNAIRETEAFKASHAEFFQFLASVAKN
uniref:Glutathione S-transferase n=1 Tax=Vannella robusta TaxID=1487602 RepID=A0A7S4HMT1_9EUKA|mmetsp:Transcript_1303/g.1681  ORF Transcript_1303/g.1681 Transcript_1303/m.1681 type:complete len:222 (+) Transcript_1303:26-691(+)|eukprot:CAMPEP_0206193550 /NCGR_PEP_ID=MMETSP0166-20121206/6638_1 /ASSEMBLY_ACC=CAM_ASM_000260 /TAXON_ID=95228 /ORGANISM="Vannella robusta, Strain DIVA3 518/3/11/1/6" /LENGTH=221 /DNA_ID=CAMNT_0053610293 /DNA_START=18 /DNA_END=683 /DNA_ORIENTATION=+